MISVGKQRPENEDPLIFFSVFLSFFICLELLLILLSLLGKVQGRQNNVQYHSELSEDQVRVLNTKG